MDIIQNLPPEILQKEFENNPLKILETIRNEKEKAIPEIESEKSENESVNIPIKEKKSITPHIIKNRLEDHKTIDSGISFDLGKNRKLNQKYINQIKNSNNSTINNINTSNNINFNNASINYNPNFNNNNNIIVNHLNIFLNFNGENDTNNNLFVNTVNKNVNNNNNNNLACTNNKDMTSNCKNNRNICIDNKNKNSGQDGKIGNNNNLLNNNINKLLNNLKSYKGSIISQAYIDNINNENDLSIFFNNISPHICQIMCLEYGNYFFQKLIKKLDIKQRLAIYQIIEPEFLVVATNKFGTHSIQSLIDIIQNPIEHLALNNLISKNMLLLFNDDNAYHIMMKIILDFPEEKRNLLNIYLVMNVEKIIINCNGAFCVNKFIVNNRNLNLRKLLVENLQNNIKKLIFNKFSCINLLLILQTFGIEWGGFIIKEIEQNFIVMTENPVSKVFICKVLEYLNNKNLLVLKLLIWSFFKNFVLINYLLSNKSQKKLLNQIITYSDNDQKKYLYVLINQSNW